MRYRLDRGTRRLDGGRVLLAGSPLTLFRLTASGQQVVDAIQHDEDVPPSAQLLMDRLIDTGAAHPRPDGSTFTLDEVTVVIPVHGHDPRPTVAGLAEVKAIVIVDDATQPPLDGIEGVTLIRHDVRQGPGAARMTGLSAVRTPLVAFIDADCVPRTGWLQPLLAHFGDGRLGLAAPRVVSAEADRRTALTRYETLRSPLDLGPAEGRIAPTTRVAFVPAAALVVRVDALRAVGGFDDELQVGEDVDLVWRVLAAGWRGRYEPRSVVAHAPRRSLAAFVEQRVGYGRSAAALDQRHPGDVAPAIVGPWAAGGWALVALGHPLAGLLAGAAPALALMKRLPTIAERPGLAARLTAVAFLRAGQQLASVLTRIWWPAALVAAVTVRRLRLPVLVAATVPPLLDWAREPGGLDPARYLGLRLLDDAAYGAGVWAGAWACRDPGALRPSFGGRGRAGPPVQKRPRSEQAAAT